MDYDLARERMVREQVEARGISDQRVLQAMRRVPRHRFVEEGLAHSSYGDHALPIGCSQTISQPYIVALMTELLATRPEDRILEIGTGSGYQAAILSRLVRTVFTIERVNILAMQAQERFRSLKIQNVVLRIGDGTLGWRRFAPFDGILVTAGAPVAPPTLIDQLRVGGRMVLPAGDRREQRLLVLERGPKGTSERWGVSCSFVPLIGREGWAAPSRPPGGGE